LRGGKTEPIPPSLIYTGTTPKKRGKRESPMQMSNAFSQIEGKKRDTMSEGKEKRNGR